MSEFYTEQIITYLGNKRKMVMLFDKLFSEQKEGFTFLDGFAGSGIVSRVAKKYASKVYCNDWEEYTHVINSCYLSNPSEEEEHAIRDLIDEVNQNRFKKTGGDYIYGNYSPLDDTDIQPHERVFFSSKNAQIIDNVRHYVATRVPHKFRKYVLAPLLYEASVKNNTCGYFNSYYKDNGVGKLGGKNSDDLGRICGEIKLPYPVFHSNHCECEVTSQNTNEIVRQLPPVDIAYFDPPYNKHPYGTFYFMLNVITQWKHQTPVPGNLRGQDNDWKRSLFNSFTRSKEAFEDLIKHTRARQIWVSYNNNGLISLSDMEDIMKKYGTLEKITFEHKTYNKLLGQGDKFRSKKNKAKINEVLYVLKKNAV